MSKAIAAVNRTGYPLQAKLESIVRAGHEKHHITVRGHEVHWSHPSTGEARFLDLLLSGVCSGPFGDNALQQVIAMECKRIDGFWTFPIARTAPPRYGEVRLLSSLATATSGPQFMNWVYGPEGAPGAEYCALSTVSANGATQADGRTLEPWATELISACTVLASQSPALAAPQGRLAGVVFVPVLVTTAALHVVSYDADAVGLSNGHVAPPPASTVSEVPCVVFSKDLGFEPGLSAWPSLRPSQRQPHQDVFIVAAPHLAVFLQSIHFIHDGRA